VEESPVYVAICIVEGNLLLFLALILYGCKQVNRRQLLISGTLLGLIISLNFFYIPIVSLVLAGLFSFIVAFFLIKLNRLQSILISFLVLGLSLAHELIITSVWCFFLRQPLSALTSIQNVAVDYLWAGIIPLAVVTKLAYSRGWQLPEGLIRLGEPGYPKMNKDTIVLLVVFQLLLLGGALVQYLFNSPLPSGNTHKHIVIVISLGVCIALNAYIAVRMIDHYERQTLSKARVAMAESLSKLAESMDMQNHDIRMHLKDISTLLEQKKLDELGHYLEKMSGKIASLNSVLKTDNPIIGALLQAKAAQADVLGIRMETDVSAPLAKLGEQSLDMARIIGNLIDNAFDAVQSLPEEQRKVSVKIHKTGPLLQVTVSNPGPPIDSAIVQRLFEPGFTTKGKGHHGLGLFIVKNLTEKLFGTIEVSSNTTERTSFKVNIPDY